MFEGNTIGNECCSGPNMLYDWRQKAFWSKARSSQQASEQDQSKMIRLDLFWYVII
jgi:hypothetical protein